MDIIGKLYKQLLHIEGYPYNKVGEMWKVVNNNDNITVLQYGLLGLGVSKVELEKYFEPHIESFHENNTSVDAEGIKCIRNGTVTIVILPDGSKGISKCLPEDTYDQKKGYEIAYTKAKMKSLNKKLKTLVK